MAVRNQISAFEIKGCGMKIYIAGKITGEESTYKEKFNKKAEELTKQGFIVMNPSVLPIGFEHDEYLHINKAMIDVCDAVWFMPCWTDSKGAQIENDYALSKGKGVIYES